MTARHFCSVGGHLFAVSLRDGALPGNYAPFEAPAGVPLFTLEETDALPELELTAVALPRDAEDDTAHVGLYEATWDSGRRRGLCFTLAPAAGTPPCARLLADRGGRTAALQCLDARQRSFVVNSSLMLLYALFTADRRTLLMHASTVVSNGCGYLFLGVSGTGKSTHSRLWMETIPGVTLLNDDNPVLRVADDGTVRVYGTPWSGKTPCYVNRDAPAGAIVDLEQAPCNAIERLALPEAYAALLSSSSGLKHDSDTADSMHATLSALLTQVPCYHLRCLPDHAAARLCHNTVAAAAPLGKAVVEIPNAILLKEVGGLLQDGKQVTLSTKGYSMLPFIRGGRDSVRLARCGRYAAGDAVLAEVAPGCYVLHRIAAIDGKNVTLAGDGNLGRTEHCLTSHIAGKVEAIVSPSGRERRVPDARVWLALPRWMRRCTLAVMRRVL